MDSHHQVYITVTGHKKSKATYDLPFKLSPQQHYASVAIVTALMKRQALLLYAVTGAGKTEMIFEAIHQARKQGLNVAIVSPRVDVIIELQIRIREAFHDEQIDVLYQGQRQIYDGHFVIATVHQLMRFKGHFDFIVVDEVDAFPLSMDPTLMSVITAAQNEDGSAVYMTATPTPWLIKQFDKSHIIRLPARFHQSPLPVPIFKYFRIIPHKKQFKFLSLLTQQIQAKRYTLVFFHNIEIMEYMYQIYHKDIETLTTVHSQDPYRLDKVEALRSGQYRVVFTTTILERGFTMANLDVIVVDSHKFSSSALIQIAGRVGRKVASPTGLVMFCHQGITFKMIKARSTIVQMNKLARKKGWIHD
ncbi:DEAD/DEAH box helicase family protein [Staphylococcus gallinarum]|uniref:DEAD/DEAH box helicase family protein n=1 Tax=Staphylococcus TaxID=1279 RepID=UPI001E5DF4A9|nr:DEAD/DEAH box helicase family protein [Staphylococcus gallinarum]